MGVAFLVLWPVAYTDTNEVWKLTRRDQRLKVAAAGIATELTIAVWAMLAWVWLPDGPLRAMAFLLATTTWVSTADQRQPVHALRRLLPAVGFPADAEPACAPSRWRVDPRERLFALGEPAPEHSSAARRGLILFAWATWIYRLVLFLGIAALVLSLLHQGPWASSFPVEIVWFIARPLWSEIGAWRQKRRGYRRQPARALERAAADPDRAGCLRAWPVPRGRPVASARAMAAACAGSVATGLAPPAEGTRCRPMRTLSCWTRPRWPPAPRKSQARSLQLARQSAAAGFDPELRRDWQVLRERQAEAQAQQVAVTAKRRATAWKRQAPAGCATVIRPAPGRLAGPPRAAGTRRERGPAGGGVCAEDALPRLRAGQARFIADGGAGPDLDLRVRSVDQDATRVLQEAVLSAPPAATYRCARRKTCSTGTAGVPGDAGRGKRRSRPGAPAQLARRVSIHGDWEAPARACCARRPACSGGKRASRNWRVGAGRAQCITRAPARPLDHVHARIGQPDRFLGAQAARIQRHHADAGAVVGQRDLTQLEVAERGRGRAVLQRARPLRPRRAGPRGRWDRRRRAPGPAPGRSARTRRRPAGPACRRRAETRPAGAPFPAGRCRRSGAHGHR